jgi:hypothetical protein
MSAFFEKADGYLGGVVWGCLNIGIVVSNFGKDVDLDFCS